MNMRRGSISSYIAVASAASVLSAIAASNIRTSEAQPAPAAPAQLLVQPLSDLPGREVRIALLDKAPGVGSPPHRHPGHHTFGYVLQGIYELAVNGQPSRILKTGEVFYEPPGAVHSVSRNPGKDEHAKILIFMVADQQKPSTVAE
jgi:quercetin dioxygenase-like cupin family protein